MKNEIETQIKVLELLNENVKYPKGSIIMFDMTNEITGLTGCVWYDKVGEGFPLKNIIRNPTEWQNLTEEEAFKIAQMFDDYVFGVFGKEIVDEMMQGINRFENK